MVDLTGKKILVVEDEAIVAMDLAQILEDAGATVLGPALSLDQADALADAEEIAAAILDVRLGRQNVFSVAGKLAARGVPLIFHTGHGHIHELAGRWPESQVLLKPVSANGLLAAVAAAALQKV
jgi:DNA-binding response OmpR family regulator